MGLEKYKIKGKMTELIEKPYHLQPATADKLGGVKVGPGLAVTADGTISATGDVDIIDNLTSTATDKALSANQGRVLKGLFDDIETLTNTEIDNIVNA